MTDSATASAELFILMPTTVSALQSNNQSVFIVNICGETDLMFYPADPYLVGAAASAFYVNDAATVLPKAIVAKARTYLAGAYADVLEV